MKYILALIIPLMLSSCKVYHEGLKLSELSVDNKRANYKIIDRIPDYGDGHSDGCIVMAQIKAELKTEKGMLVGGTVSNVANGMPLHKASITIHDGIDKTYQYTTDSLGQFIAAFPTKKRMEMRIEYLGYRPLRVKL